MIIAGIDEAGYGPLLGPLVVGCCAFQLDAVPRGTMPCLWRRLGHVVSRRRNRSGKKLHVNDSKLVYSPATGLRELERSVLALHSTFQSWPDDLDAFLNSTASHALDDIRQYPWYAPAGEERFPIEQDAMPLRLMTNAVRAELARTATRCVHLQARVVPERQLNRLFDSTRNKAAALFSIAAIHLDALLRTYGGENLTIICDRQGGREHYGALLRLMFDEWNLEILQERDGYSDYLLRQNEKAVRLTFCEKAEGRCLATALASMLSKYLREALMRRFNAWWRKHLPQLEPTAGYYSDGERFLRDIDSTRRQLGIEDDHLIRAR